MTTMKRALPALLALLVLFFAVRAVARALASDETKIRWVLEDMADGFNDTRMNPILAGLDPEFLDEHWGADREMVRAGLAQLFLQAKDAQTKKFPYRVALPESELKTVVQPTEPRTAETDLVAAFEQSQGEVWQPAWKIRVHAQWTLLPGGWRIKHTQTVEVEGKRPR
jgi:hypothetical protein